MKRTLSIVCAFCMSTAAFGQTDDGKGVMMNPEGNYDLLSEAWFFEDANPLETGQWDLRFNGQWRTGREIGSHGDEFGVTPSIVWGFAEDWELSVDVPIWLGDGGNVGPFQDGNYDTYVGALWRFHQQQPFMARKGEVHWPSMALSGELRIPTGDGSEGVDFELRFITTYEYTSGVRSHFNIFGKTVNGDNWSVDNIDWDSLEGGLSRVGQLVGIGAIYRNDIEPRNFQYGAVLGADGPLWQGCENMRWVADYFYRSSFVTGISDLHLGEAGIEWEITDTSKLGLSVQANLDHRPGFPDWGTNVVYSYSLGS